MRLGEISGSVVSVANSGSVHQLVRVDSLALPNQTHRFIEAIPDTGNDLSASQKNTAIHSLNTPADQAVRPPPQRESSKIIAALKLLPGLVGTPAALAKA